MKRHFGLVTGMAGGFWRIGLGLAVAVAWLQASQAHEGHDHGAPPPPVSASIAPRFEASSEAFELVGVLRDGKLTLHLDRFLGNRPVADAEIEIDTPVGPQKAQRLGGGSYQIEAPFAAMPGSHDLIATITVGSEIDVLTAALSVPNDEPGKPKPGATDLAQRLPDGAVFVPKPSQRILGLANQKMTKDTHPQAITLPGRIVPDPNASGVVQASVAGRISAPPGGFKRLGTPVKAGEVLAFVQPAISTADLASQAQQIRELEQQVTLVSRRLERFRQVTAGTVTRAQVEDAELELAGLQARRQAVERIQREPEPLVAPVDGVLAAANVVAGQMADPNSILFQIVDPDRLWVEALSYAGVVAGDRGSAILPDGRALSLAFEGAGLSDRNQAVPLHFSILAREAGLRLGQLVTVNVATGRQQEGISVPRASVIRAANGTMLVYEQSNPERFVPREVRVEPLDAERVIVLSGLEPGKRIVTTGAELLHQVR
ncbi:efflux RND transporter periplasmic adaptor subunit [Rhabdaerophilum sp. SD176]|uniref:efflux RND transporter periplasmic adaptor subunit n=1 Tax=Rhabdaerophilum sp. SD176 TaxID=2983548 RepID=UPI0024DF6283|nr:efflux RND transporter periplasmic adaptor subunit [Rhabdaerophilum sp. SD176]